MIKNKDELFERIYKNFEERGFSKDILNNELKKQKEDAKKYNNGEFISNSLGYYALLFKDEKENIIDIFCASPTFEQIDVYFDWSEENRLYFTISLYSKEDIDGVKDSIMFEYISKEGDTFETMLKVYKERLEYIQKRYSHFECIVKNLISLYNIN